jgi:GT2 family glycosyltransferase
VNRISVVMMAKDGRERLLRTLKHLESLPERPPVVLVDNGSSDGSVAAVRAEFPAVEVVPLPQNQGAVARTIGVRRTRTPYVAFSDDDSWWEPGALERAVEYFEADSRLGLLAARILVGPDRRLDPVCELMAASPLPPVAAGPSVLGFVTCGSVVRRTAFLEAGGFSPVIFFFGEETVLAQDLAALGWHRAYADDVVALHHPEDGPAKSGRRQLEIRNRLLSAWLRRPLPVVARLTADAARTADGRAALRAVARRLPAALRDRTQLPAEVETQVRVLERT